MGKASQETNELVKGAATLVTCIVHSLNQRDPDYRRSFLDTLSQAYGMMRDNPSTGHNDLGLQMLSYTRTLITGFNVIDGPGEQLFSGEIGTRG